MKINKSEEIRIYKKENAAAKPREIAAALGERGIAVSAQFVSVILSNNKQAGIEEVKTRKERRLKSPNNISLVKYNKLLVTLLQDEENWMEINGIKNWVDSTVLRGKFFPLIELTDAARQRENERERDIREKSKSKKIVQQSIEDKILAGKRRIFQRCLNNERRVVKSDDGWFIRLADSPQNRKKRVNLRKLITSHIEEKKQISIEELSTFAMPHVEIKKRPNLDVLKAKQKKINAVICKLRNKNSILIENNIITYVKKYSWKTNE